MSVYYSRHYSLLHCYKKFHFSMKYTHLLCNILKIHEYTSLLAIQKMSEGVNKINRRREWGGGGGRGEEGRKVNRKGGGRNEE